jgi:hypothetical protein
LQTARRHNEPALEHVHNLVKPALGQVVVRAG